MVHNQFVDQGSRWFTGLILICLSLGITAGIHYFQLMESWNIRLFETMAKLQWSVKITDPKLVIVSMDRNRQSGSASQLLTLLREKGATKIGFLFLPDEAEFKELAAQGNDVVLGRSLVPHNGRPQLAPLPASLVGIPWGVLAQAGFNSTLPHNMQRKVYAVGGAFYPSMEALLAQEQSSNRADPYMINLYRSASDLFQFEARKLLAGQVPEHMIRGRTVLVAATFLAEFANFNQVPVSPSRSLTMAEYHGFALNTLLNDLHIRKLPPGLFWSVLCLLAILLGLLYQRSPFFLAARLSLMLPVLVLGLGWLALLLFHLWLPIADLLILLALLFFSMVFRKYSLLTTTLHRQILDSSSFMQQRNLPKSFYASNQHWAQVANMVKQTLQLKRTIFLARVAGDHRCHEVIALGCGIEDISEKRRDFHRAPYTTALKQQDPLRLQRAFLSRLEEGEVQYLVPLVFAGEINGFWALSLSTDMIGDRKSFDKTVNRLASEIAELLHYRLRYLNATKGHSFIKLFSFNLDEELGQLLSHSTALMERYLTRLERVVERSNTEIVLYDLFGQILLVNEGMSKTLISLGIHPFQEEGLTLADMVIKLTGYKESAVKGFIQNILQKDEEFSFPVNVSEKRSVMLILRGISRNDLDIETSPFSKLGILCELVDITPLQRLNELKEKIIGQTTMMMRSDLMALSLAADFLNSEEISPEDKAGFLATIKERMHSLEDLLNQASQYLEAFTLNFNVPFFPVDFLGILAAAKNKNQALEQQRKLSWNSQCPKLLKFVLGSPKELLDLLVALIQLCAEDAERGSALSVAIRETPGTLSFSLSSKGYGIPNDLLQKTLKGERDSDQQTLRSVKKGMAHVADWSGSLELSSEVGRGFQCTLILKTYGR